MFLTKEEFEKFYLYEGKTYQEIADLYGVSKKKIFSIAKKYNIKPCKIKRDKLPPEKEVLEKLYFKENKTCAEVAEIFKVSRITQRKWFREYGIKTKRISDYE